MTTSANALQGSFNFAPDDLAANRDGYISPRQQARLHTQIRRANRIAMGFVFGLALVPVGGLIVFAPQRNWPIVGLNVFLLVLLPLMGYAIASGENLNWQRDIQHKVAASVYGVAALSPESGRKDAMLSIDGTMFAINAAQAAAIVPGEIYTVYYGPRSNKILSIEPAEADR